MLQSFISGVYFALPMNMDDKDYLILRELQRNARTTNLDLARLAGLSPTGLQKRLEKLEAAGVIGAYVAVLDREKLGYDLMCFVHVNLRYHSVDLVRKFRAAVKAMPEALECHHITGEADYVLKIAVRDRQHLESFLVNTLTPAPGVERIRTSLVLNEIKSTTALQLGTDPEPKHLRRRARKDQDV